MSNWRKEEDDKATRHEQTRLMGRTPCDVCGGPATVWVSCRADHFASFRCEPHAQGLKAHFEGRGMAVVIERLASAVNV